MPQNKFFLKYNEAFPAFQKQIKGITKESDRHSYASIILNRLMFIYFLQKKGLIDNNNQHYLYEKLKTTKEETGENQYYTFLKQLFFESLKKAGHPALFVKHKIEEKYPAITIPDIAFEKLLQPGEPKGLFEQFTWSVDASPAPGDNEITPGILGYIFEKNTNQKTSGAYYTCIEITSYLCEQTIYKLILDAMNEEPRPPYTSITELMVSLDAAGCRKLIYGEAAVLANLSLLDPACGSGEFLMAAMKIVTDLYAAIFNRIDSLGDKELSAWKAKIEQDHPSIDYYIKRQVITNNLYGVDIMPGATEIAKQRLYLSLVASIQTVDHLEQLPAINFNISCGNSLIGLLSNEAGSNQQLNELLLKEFSELGIKYEQPTWDDAKNREGKPVERKLSVADIKALNPIHWSYEFPEVFSKKDGFDAIITNPPWEVFQTNEKEFFQEYDKEIKRKKLRIEDWEKSKEELMKDDEIREAWLSYSAKFPHQWAWLKSAAQYKNQHSIINGKAVGNKPNLYCLFIEQCKNLLKQKGYCGMVVPAGIYTDLGTKQLRQMLFEGNTITGLFCFENRQLVFENVDSRFKFVVLSFEKGGRTTTFPTAFMRHDVKELKRFPTHGALNLSVDLIKKLSPDSYSIIEFKNELELTIAETLSKHPLLSGDKEGWNLELYGEEMNMTRSAANFLTRPADCTLYEGSTIGHFTNSFSQPRYWIKEEDIRAGFLDRKVKRIEGLSSPPKDLKNDYETYRLAIRKIASNTNERTLITTIIPKYAIAGNSLTVHFPFQHHSQNYNELNFSNSDLLILTSLLNSYIVDFILRSRVTTNLNLFYLYQLPVPRLSMADKWYQPVISRAARLICTTVEFAGLWEEAMKTKWTEKVGANTEHERNNLKADLDGIIAHIYGLTEDQFRYILGTFPIVAAAQKEAAHQVYKDIIINGTLK